MDQPYLGQINLFAGNFEPRGWRLCDGRLLNINQNTALFSLLGTTYGGNGQTTFGLPDLRGRVPVGIGQGPGLSNVVLGEMRGLESVTLTPNQMPAHTHAATVTINTGKDTNLTNVATGKALSSDAKGGDVPPMMYTDTPNATTLRADAATAVVAAAGANQPHNNMQPYLGVGYYICVEGIYPSRW